MIGVEVKVFFRLSKAVWNLTLNSKGISFANKLHRGLVILLKSLMNLFYDPACPRNNRISSTIRGGGRLEIISTLALSTFIHL
jgi:hypothetical protein